MFVTVTYHTTLCHWNIQTSNMYNIKFALYHNINILCSLEFALYDNVKMCYFVVLNNCTCFIKFTIKCVLEYLLFYSMQDMFIWLQWLMFSIIIQGSPILQAGCWFEPYKSFRIHSICLSVWRLSSSRHWKGKGDIYRSVQ